MALSDVYMSAIQKFEGFTQKASWDYAQFTNGYGTRAQYDGETITRAEAEKRFTSEIKEARTIVERFAPNLDEGTTSALTSLTFNAGTSWMKAGLGQAISRGDLDQAREIFVQYNKAGGKVLPGLVARRTAEVEWIGASGQAGPEADVVAAAANAEPSSEAGASTAVHFSGRSEPAMLQVSNTFALGTQPEFHARMTLEVLELLARTDAGVMAETDTDKQTEA